MAKDRLDRRGWYLLAVWRAARSCRDACQVIRINHLSAAHELTIPPRKNVPSSQAAFERACRVIPGGVNSPARAFGAVGGAAARSSPAARGRTSSTSTATATSITSAPGGR